jgi:hypothetical protein
MIEKKSLGKAEEALVEASYYWDMYFSDVCWKGKQYCQDNVGTATIGVGKGGGSKREYANTSAWFGMDAICNYMVTQRCEEIGG